MTQNALTAPVGGQNSGTPIDPKRTVAPILAGLSGLVICLWIGWVWVVDNPLGGEPLAVATIDRSVQGLGGESVDFGEIRLDEERDVLLARETDGGWTYESGAQAVIGGPRIAPIEGFEGGLAYEPDPRLVEEGLMGSIPRLADDGTRPMDVYSAPMPAAALDTPKIAIIVGGMGLSQTRSYEAIKTLPREVTFAFSPYGASLDRWVREARQRGHELLLQIPLEPFDYPDNDPGPHTLLVGNTSSENQSRLHWVMSRISNYVGLINDGGARFTATEGPIQRLVEEIASRGLMMVDDGSSSRTLLADKSQSVGLPYVKSDAVIDATPSRAEVQSRLLQLEQLARSRGYAVGAAAALPISIDEITVWAEGLEERGVKLVPVTAIEALISGRLDG